MNKNYLGRNSHGQRFAIHTTAVTLYSTLRGVTEKDSKGIVAIKARCMCQMLDHMGVKNFVETLKTGKLSRKKGHPSKGKTLIVIIFSKCPV